MSIFLNSSGSESKLFLTDPGVTWEAFRSYSVSQKREFFQRGGEPFDILYSQQFSRSYLDDLYALTNKIRMVSKRGNGRDFLSGILRHKKAMIYFVQPSTRTFLSFSTACQTLGIKASDVRSVETSSEKKGESFEDTIRTFSSYFDVIIMRHPCAGYAERAAFALNMSQRSIPIINAGSGKDQHPTQALLDIYTLRKSFEERGGLVGKKVMLVGDLRRGRTVRSLCYLLSNFRGIEIIFCSPEELRMREDIKVFLGEKGISFLETADFRGALGGVDAIYMTRLQDEYEDGLGNFRYKQEDYALGRADLGELKAEAIILHPLPRRLEILPEVDRDERAMYWRQVRNGMWTRCALLAKILGVGGKILSYPTEGLEGEDDE